MKTDEAGRAQFDNVPAGSSVKAVAIVDGERLESQEFQAPAQGGIRLLLVATDNGVGVGKINPACPKAFITLMNSYKAKIIAGTLKVPAAIH